MLKTIMLARLRAGARRSAPRGAGGRQHAGGGRRRRARRRPRHRLRLLLRGAVRRASTRRSCSAGCRSTPRSARPATGCGTCPSARSPSRAAPALTEEQMRAYAAHVRGRGRRRPASSARRRPTDHFPPSTVENAPDLSLMAKARAGFHGPVGPRHQPDRQRHGRPGIHRLDAARLHRRGARGGGRRALREHRLRAASWRWRRSLRARPRRLRRRHRRDPRADGRRTSRRS